MKRRGGTKSGYDMRDHFTAAAVGAVQHDELKTEADVGAADEADAAEDAVPPAMAVVCAADTIASMANMSDCKYIPRSSPANKTMDSPVRANPAARSGSETTKARLVELVLLNVLLLYIWVSGLLRFFSSCSLALEPTPVLALVSAAFEPSG